MPGCVGLVVQRRAPEHVLVLRVQSFEALHPCPLCALLPPDLSLPPSLLSATNAQADKQASEAEVKTRAEAAKAAETRAAEAKGEWAGRQADRGAGKGAGKGAGMEAGWRHSDPGSASLIKMRGRKPPPTLPSSWPDCCNSQ